VFVLPLVNLVESLHLLPYVIGEREEWIFVVLSLGGFLNNVDVGKPLWRVEPRDESLFRVCCDLYTCSSLFMLVLDYIY
jgi:hypothetical protein